MPLEYGDDGHVFATSLNTRCTYDHQIKLQIETITDIVNKAQATDWLTYRVIL
jgi:hypothetical protein